MSIRVRNRAVHGTRRVHALTAGGPTPSRLGRASAARLCALAGVVGTLALLLATLLGEARPAVASSFKSASQNVALIPGRGPKPPEGQMPVSGIVSGMPGESFGRFNFTNVPLSGITTEGLKRFDTVALIQVTTSELSATQKSVLAQFVTEGGKLVIHDSDETSSNDYSWLPYAGKVGAGCKNCGATTGSSTIVANNGLISSNPSDGSYVNLTELGQRTDAIGDANLFVTLDSHWQVSATGTNAIGDTGAVVASANDNGMIIYNGYDTDYVRPTSASGSPWLCREGSPPNYECPPPASGVDWLAKMWYDELAQSWSSNGSSVSAPSAAGVGQSLAPGVLGGPGTLQCVARRRVSLSFTKVHSTIRQADVYVNGRHVMRIKGRRLTHVTVTKLPRKGAYTIRVILTNSRRYHLIMRSRYRAC